MKIQILSKRKKRGNLDSYTKRQLREVKCFIYDEDVFWFDFKGQRFGLSIPQILEQRKKLLKDLEKDGLK